MVFQVEADSPASRANLRDSDIIIQINKVNIRQKSSMRVRKYVSNLLDKERIELLVIDRAGYDFYKSKYRRMSAKSIVTDCNVESFYTDAELWAEGETRPAMPRLCRIEGGFKQLGFSVSASKSEKGYFILNELVSGSPADKAGIMNNDVIRNSDLEA